MALLRYLLNAFEVCFCLWCLLLGLAYGAARSLLRLDVNLKKVALAGVCQGVGSCTEHCSRNSLRSILEFQQSVSLAAQQALDKNVQYSKHALGYLLSLGPARGPPDAIILTVHGGAMVVGSPLMYAPALVQLLRLLRDQHGLNAQVLAVHYDLAPEHPYPTALQQVCAALQWLAGNGGAAADGTGGGGLSGPAPPTEPPPILLMGDSAGGNLLVSSLMLLHQASTTRPPGASPAWAQTGPPCAGMVLVSPWLDLSSPVSSTRDGGIGRDHVYPCARQGVPAASCECVARQRQRLQRDMLRPMILVKAGASYIQPPAPASADTAGRAKPPAAPGQGAACLTDPLVSPAQAPPQACAAAIRASVAHPPLVLAGGDEILLPDIMRWVDAVNNTSPSTSPSPSPAGDGLSAPPEAPPGGDGPQSRAAGRVCQLVVEPDCPHNFPLLPLLLEHMQHVSRYMAEVVRATRRSSTAHV